MKILFLDDDEERHRIFKGMSIGHSVDHVRTVEEAILQLNHKAYDFICLDHDLSGLTFVNSEDPAGTGYTVACHMASMKHMPRPIQVVVHSFNPEGAHRMALKLEEAGFKIVQAPFGTFTLPKPVAKEEGE